MRVATQAVAHHTAMIEGAYWSPGRPRGDFDHDRMIK
jgi:hypothetical protein